MIDTDSTRWIANVEQDEYGDLFFTIPLPIREKLGWNIGDTLVWTIHDDNSVTLKKQEKK